MIPEEFKTIKSTRGADWNPENRFASQHHHHQYEYVEFDPGEESPPVRTQYLNDPTGEILSTNNSPDLGFDTSINPYRGCEHGCIYCYARPTHEYLDYGSGLDFETKILVKHQAPHLLRSRLSHPKWRPRLIALSGVTDPYQPVERRLQLTRNCLEVFLEFRNPVGIVTKNALVTRDIDLLSKLACYHACSVMISITSLDLDLKRRMEPRTSPPAQRLEAVRKLSENGIPVGVLVAPVIPGLNDMEIPSILKSASEAGARFASMIPLRLPYAVKDLFINWLKEVYPDRMEKVLSRIRDMRGGKLNDSSFEGRMYGGGFHAEQTRRLFEVSRRKAGLAESPPPHSIEHFRSPANSQLKLDLDI